MENKLHSPKKIILIFHFVLCLILLNDGLIAQNYQWNTIRVGGGGCTTSIQAHPIIENLYFITTDVGTPYRWNNSKQCWEGLFYNLPATYWGKAAASNIAFDPGDTTGNLLYATIGGAWTTGGILKSLDRGESWTDCQIPLDVKPNNDQIYGQRLAVDPKNSGIVLVTTRPSAATTQMNGTFKSIAAGAPGSWTKINDLYGSFITFDTSDTNSTEFTKTIYIGCNDGIYCSKNGGLSFSLMASSPTNSIRGVIHNSGILYVTHKSGVSKWDGVQWTSITPSYSGTYIAIDVNPNNSEELIVGGGDRQFVSKDGGKSWINVYSAKDNAEIPWFSEAIGGGLKDFCWDPFDRNKVWFTDFFDAHVTSNIWSGSSVTWKARAVGHEETCATGNLLCPPSGVNILLSNVADVGGWDHKSINASPTIGMVSLFPWTFSGDVGNMTGVAVQETNPNFIARVGSHGWSGAGYAGYSTDGGATYTYWTCPSGARSGRIAVAANSETMVWVTQSGSSYRSVDRGQNWTLINTLPTAIIGGSNNFASGSMFPLAADKVNGKKFYVYAAGKVYISDDAGITFKIAASVPAISNVGNLVLESTPGIEGDVWLGIGSYGLYHSTNSCSTFIKINNVQNADLIAIGKSSPSTPDISALYVFGTVNNIPNSLFRSNDNGVTWEVLSSVVKTGLYPYCMAADRNTYGRVFFATGGNGFFVTTPSGSDTEEPTPPTGLTFSSLTENTVILSWKSSTDNVGVTGYDVYQNKVFVGSTRNKDFNVTNLSCNTTYAFTVRAKDGSGNVSSESNAISITTSLCKSVASVTLINADTDLSIQTLNEGATLDLAKLPTKRINIRANTRPGTVGSVVFDLTGSENRSFIENSAPYALYGKVGTDYNSWIPQLGNYELTVTPYEGPNASGAKGTILVRNFTIVDSAPNSIEDVFTAKKNNVIYSIQGNKLSLMLIDKQDETHLELVIYDISGRIMCKQKVNMEGVDNQAVQMDIGNLNDGLYILSVRSKTVIENIKIMIG